MRELRIKAADPERQHVGRALARFDRGKGDAEARQGFGLGLVHNQESRIMFSLCSDCAKDSSSGAKARPVNDCQGTETLFRSKELCPPWIAAILCYGVPKWLGSLRKPRTLHPCAEISLLRLSL